jgi:hypothetical protein
MNNTKTLAIVAIFMAATLVVGTFAATTTTQAVFAYSKKRGGSQEDSKNGNTVTIQACKQGARESGFDNSLEQECQNVICTHPGENATCVRDPGEATPATGTLLVKKVVVCKDDIITNDCENQKFKITVRDDVANEFVLGNGDTQVVTLGAGSTYTVSEPNHAGFTVSFSADCTGTIAAGVQKTCTVTNTERKV